MSILSIYRANTINKYYWLCDDNFAKWIVGHLTPYGNSILDVGCGNGFMIAYYLNSFDRIGAIEPTAELFKELLRKYNNDEVSIHQAFAEEMPLIDNSYDIVLAKSSLHHFQNPIKGIQEMKRVGKKVVAIIEAVTPNQKYIPFVKQVLIKKEKDREENSIFTVESLIEFIKSQLSEYRIFPLLYDQYIDVLEWLLHSDLAENERMDIYNRIKDSNEEIKSNLQIHYRDNRLQMLRRMCMCVAIKKQVNN